jgi:hypothetical protein
MAEVTKTGTPTVSTAAPIGAEHRLTGLTAGEEIAAGDAVYIKASDGLVYKATGAAANEAARVAGFAPTPASAGEAVSIYRGMNVAYGPKVAAVAVNPGTPLYLSGTVAGGLADAASTGGTIAIAYVIDTDGRIFFKSNW